ncbi:hypothetical protein [Kangiella sp.]|uniref:hypothetical protein n=1 Tax=Kangiella sp. TaxID=1920245 RepID=UPI003A93698A
MNNCFSFRFFEPNEKYRKSLVIFTESKVGLDTISRVLKRDVSENLNPKHVYLISSEGYEYSLKFCAADQGFSQEFESLVGDNISNRLRCMFSTFEGRLNYCDKKIVTDDLRAAILQAGMLKLFKKHSGLIVSNTAYHFVKPSGAHCDKFIRASNLLVSSSEVTFLAVSLLPYLNRDLKRIYVDTSSIAFLVSTAVRLYSKFECGVPAIESFESYAALNQSYDFVEDSSSLIMISATTSGSLSKKILDITNFTNNQVVTLFFTNLPGDHEGIFDVSGAITGGIVSTKFSECEFCKRGSKPIRITGDQFLPENPKHESLVVRKLDFSSNREKFFKQFAATGVLHWNRSSSSLDSYKEHFYVDAKVAIEGMGKDFLDRLEKLAKKHISRDLKIVITLDDEGSEALKNSVLKFIGDYSEIKFLSARTFTEADVSGFGSVLVIASAITSGRSLLAVARKLRGINQSSTIVYFVGFSKLPGSDAKSQFEKDLKQGGHELVILNDCPLPRIKEYSKTAWDWEREMLHPLGEDDPLGDSDDLLPDLLNQRRQKLLDDSLSSDDLFLPNAENSPLKLRRTFAFWSDLDFDGARLEKTSQADVYWTIQSVLHDLRVKSENGGLSTAYHTTLISPANFDRFNDGIIQASILRAAHPVELDYRLDHVFSRQMTDVCLSVIRNWDNEQGEAALEFLIALWSGRMHLLDEHLSELTAFIDSVSSPEVKFLLEQLSHEVATE